uniref:Uncharacterized protein n=1 Tax=Anopheles coluzzii TaxID=1518534 RepID=A0A8W7PLF7_ANOCL
MMSRRTEPRKRQHPSRTGYTQRASTTRTRSGCVAKRYTEALRDCREFLGQRDACAPALSDRSSELFPKMFHFVFVCPYPYGSFRTRKSHPAALRTTLTYVKGLSTA